MTDPLKEAVKEFFRVIIAGVIPAVIASLGIITAGINVQAGTFAIAWNVVAAVFLVKFLSDISTGLAKALDKFLHELNKELPKKDQNSGVFGQKGITGL